MHKFVCAFVSALLLTSSLAAQTPPPGPQPPAPKPPGLVVPDVHFPNPPTPSPTPTPNPTPGSAVVLKPGILYVVTASAPIAVLSSPVGVISVTPETGPLTMYGTFSDGTGGFEKRTYIQPNLYIVQAVAKPGSVVTSCELLAVKSLTDPKAIDRQSITTDVPPPVPPPGPVPPGPPGPNPPAPAGTGVWAIVVFDQAAPTLEQGVVLAGPTLDKLRQSGKARVFGNRDDASEITKNKYDVVMQRANVQAPAVMVLDKEGKPVGTIKLPKTDAELETFLKGTMQP